METKTIKFIEQTCYVCEIKDAQVITPLDEPNGLPRCMYFTECRDRCHKKFKINVAQIAAYHEMLKGSLTFTTHKPLCKAFPELQPPIGSEFYSCDCDYEEWIKYASLLLKVGDALLSKDSQKLVDMYPDMKKIMGE